jgi:hypothetical protein
MKVNDLKTASYSRELVLDEEGLPHWARVDREELIRYIASLRPRPMPPHTKDVESKASKKTIPDTTYSSEEGK